MQNKEESINFIVKLLHEKDNVDSSFFDKWDRFNEIKEYYFMLDNYNKITGDKEHLKDQMLRIAALAMGVYQIIEEENND